MKITSQQKKTNIRQRDKYTMKSLLSHSNFSPHFFSFLFCFKGGLDQLLYDNLTRQMQVRSQNISNNLYRNNKIYNWKMSLTPIQADVLIFVCFAKDRLSKREWRVILQPALDSLSNLLLDAGSFWSIVLPLRDVALHLGTNRRLLI